MTDLLSPDTPDIASPWRRGGGAGGTGGASGSPTHGAAVQPGSSRRCSNERSSENCESQLDCQTPFRLGAGGLVVVVVPAQLKAACARRGWSLTQLARRAGISYPTLKSTLRGKPVRPITAWKLARALGDGNPAPEFDRLVESY